MRKLKRLRLIVLTMMCFYSMFTYSQTGIWTSASELANLPTSGYAWETLLIAANRDFSVPDITNNNSTDNVDALAAAIVYARTGDVSYKNRVIAACEALVTNGNPGGGILTWNRNTGAFAAAADLVGYRTPAFEQWLRDMAENYHAIGGQTILSTFYDHPNNWGMMAFGSLSMIYSYLQDDFMMKTIRNRWVQMVEGPYPGLVGYFGDDLSWHNDINDLRIINPKGSIKNGLNIDGIGPDDMRRNGSFSNPPPEPGTSYHWEVLQGQIAAARVIERYNPELSIWAIGDYALLRAFTVLEVDWQRDFGTASLPWAAHGDDTWMLPIVDKAYGSNFSENTIDTTRLWDHGKIAGWGYVTLNETPRMYNTPFTSTINLSADPFAFDRVSLSWTDYPNEDGYTIEISYDNGITYSLLSSVAANVTSFTASGLNRLTEYCFRVKGFNLSGSSSNNDICVTTPDFSGGGGIVIYEESVTGGGTGNSVTTDANISAVDNNLYVAAISSLNHQPVVSVSGLGLEWSLIKDQGGARGKSGISLWSAHGNPTVSDPVTAVFASSVTNSTISVSRFSGCDNLNPVGSSIGGNSFGIDGHETGGIDSDNYSFELQTYVSGTKVFVAASGRTKLHSSGVDYTQQLEFFNGVTGQAIQEKNVGAASTVTVDGSFSGKTDWAVCAIEIRSSSQDTVVVYPPSAPSNVTATAISASEINLSWTDNSNNETGFKVQRSNDGGMSYADIATLPIDAVSYSDTGLLPSTTYNYKVVAFNGDGNSNYSVVSATTFVQPPTTVPEVPTSVQTLSVSSSQIDLTWVDNSIIEDGFILESSVDNGVSYTVLDSVPSNTSSYSDTGLTASTLYSYRIKSYNIIGDSGYSNVSSAQTKDAVPPIAPNSLNAQVISSSEINLNWIDNSTDELGFIVYISNDGGTNFVVKDSVSTNIVDYRVTGLSESTAYSFKISSYNQFGNSNFSNQVIATTDAAPVFKGLWTSAEELAGLDITGPEWTAVKRDADTNFYPPVLANNDSNDDVNSLAAAIVFARTGDVTYKQKVIDALEYLVAQGRPDPSVEILTWCRNITSFVLAADLVGYRTSAFEQWLRNMAEVYVNDYSSPEFPTILETFYIRPNNWGAMAFAALSSIYSYLGDDAMLQNIRNYWIQLVEGPSPAKARWTTDLSWHVDSNNPRLMNPVGATKNGLNIDGLGADMYRNGSFTTSPTANTDYLWEALQGQIVAGRILERYDPNYSIWSVSSNAILRSALIPEVDYRNNFNVGFAADGDDAWLLPFIDAIYGTNLRANTVDPGRLWDHGKCGGYPYVVLGVLNNPNRPPLAPSNLNATSISSVEISLNWTENSSNEDGFIISISEDNGVTYTDIATVGAGVTSYTSTGLTHSTSYMYKVRAFNAFGNSLYSNVATATTFGITPPAAASNLVASVWSSSEIKLDWVDNSNDENGFIIQASTDNGLNYIAIDTVGVNVNSYIAINLSDDTQYDFRIVAYNVNGNGGNSNIASAKTLPLGSLTLEETVTGSGSSILSLTTSTEILGVPNNLYVASIANIGNRYVASVEGLGLTWTLVKKQSGGRNTQQLAVWIGQGIPTGNGFVQVNFSNRVSSAVVSVSRYSGADFSQPIGSVVSANTNGIDGKVSGGSDSNSYSYVMNTVYENSFVIESVSNKNMFLTPGSNFTSISDTSYSTSGLNVLQQIVTVPSTVTIDGTFPGKVDWSVIAIELKGGGGSSGGGVIPISPSNLVASAISQSQIDLSWSDNSNNEDGFTIEQSTDGGLNYSVLGTVSPNVTSYSVTGLSASTSYSYRVSSFNSVGSSAVSNTATATTLSASTGGGTGTIVFEEEVSGTTPSGKTVSTSTAIAGVSGNFYIATVANYGNRTVSSVKGLGLNWSLLTVQSGGRNTQQLTVFTAQGAPTGDGVVTATYNNSVASGVISVSRYSGVNSTTPVGNIVSANSNGLNGKASGGSDSNAFAFDLATSQAGSYVQTSISTKNKATTFDTSFALRGNVGIEATGVTVIDKSVSSVSTVNISGSFSSKVDWSAIAIELKPANMARGSNTETNVFVESSEEPYKFISYPNPFKESTTILFNLPKSSNVSIDIYNLNGKRVAILANSSYLAGNYRLEWNRLSSTGNRLPAGMYIVKILAGKYLKTIKMIVVD